MKIMSFQSMKSKPCNDEKPSNDEKDANISPSSSGVGDLEMISKAPVNASSYPRLKLQENMLFTSAKQALSTMTCRPELDAELRNLEDQRKADLETLKDTYLDIKNTINILRNNISTLDKIKKLDVARYRNSVVQLEERIITFKRFLREELKLLQGDERTLVSEVDHIAKIISQHDIVAAVKSYTCVIPSKIKTLRTTPSISPEVRAFQEFVDRSGGHDGGWGQNQHFLFLKFRKKLTDSSKTLGDGKIQENQNMYLNKLAEVLCSRIPGLTPEDVAHHETWYNTYLKLKVSQQSAIEKWRALKQLLKYEQEADKEKEIEIRNLEKDKSHVGLQTKIVMVNKKCSTSLGREPDMTLEEIQSRSQDKQWELERHQLEMEIRELTLQETRAAQANIKLREYRARDRQIMEKRKQQLSQTQIKPATPVKTPSQIQPLEYKVYRQCDTITLQMTLSDTKLLTLKSHTKVHPKSQSDSKIVKNKQCDKKNKSKNHQKDVEKSQSDTMVRRNNIDSEFVNLSNSECYNKFMKNCNFEVFSESSSNNMIKARKYYRDKINIDKPDTIEIKSSISDTALQYDIESDNHFERNMGGNPSDITLGTRKSQSHTRLGYYYNTNNYSGTEYANKNETDITMFNKIHSDQSNNDSDTKFMYEIQSVLYDTAKFGNNNKFTDKFINKMCHVDYSTKKQPDLTNIKYNHSEDSALKKVSDIINIKKKQCDTQTDSKSDKIIIKIKNKSDFVNTRNVECETLYCHSDNTEKVKSVIDKSGKSDANQSSDISKCGFAAPTKEWSQRVKNKRENKTTNYWSLYMAMENIPKLGQPKWRRPLSANQEI